MLLVITLGSGRDLRLSGASGAHGHSAHRMRTAPSSAQAPGTPCLHAAARCQALRGPGRPSRHVASAHLALLSHGLESGETTCLSCHI